MLENVSAPFSLGAAMAGHLDFYFFYGSIHSYLSVMRIGALASAAGVEVR
jgi:2-hydroxychromene-2-carboxylate isomerase